MLGAAGAAFGCVAAQEAVNCARSVASTARSAAQEAVNTGRAFFNGLSGRRYTVGQKDRLLRYHKLCSDHCTQASHLEYLAFNETDFCPTKTKTDLEGRLQEPRAQMENVDTPFNVSKERRALSRCIKRALSAEMRRQEDLPIFAPEVYVLMELMRWSNELTAEPTDEVIEMLKGRTKYITEVNRFSLDHGGTIAYMSQLLNSMKQLLSSCREKAKYHEWRLLLPRIHGEVNSTCESMDFVLASILRCCEEKPTRIHDAATGDMHQVVSAMDKCAQNFLVHSSADHQASVADIYRNLFRLTHEVQDINHRTLERFLLVSDGMPLTSASNADSTAVQNLRQCLHVLAVKLKSIDTYLQTLCTYCDTLYNESRLTSACQRWKANYDDIRDDIEDVHASVDKFLRYRNEADAFLHQMSSPSPKRLRSVSPPSRSKKLKMFTP